MPSHLPICLGLALGFLAFPIVSAERFALLGLDDRAIWLVSFVAMALAAYAAGGRVAARFRRTAVAVETVRAMPDGARTCTLLRAAASHRAVRRALRMARRLAAEDGAQPVIVSLPQGATRHRDAFRTLDDIPAGGLVVELRGEDEAVGKLDDVLSGAARILIGLDRLASVPVRMLEARRIGAVRMSPDQFAKLRATPAGQALLERLGRLDVLVLETEAAPQGIRSARPAPGGAALVPAPASV